MQDKTMQKLDNYGRYTLFGVYEECKEEMSKEIISLKKRKGSDFYCKNIISYRLFAEVVTMYFVLYFQKMIDGSIVELYNRFGTIQVVKTKCIRYLPKRVSFFRNSDGELERKLVNCKMNFGYWHFVFWSAPKKFRQYRFLIDMKYKHKFMDKVNNGFEYLDYTLDKYGRNASVDYIHHVK